MTSRTPLPITSVPSFSSVIDAEKFKSGLDAVNSPAFDLREKLREEYRAGFDAPDSSEPENEEPPVVRTL